MTSAAARMLLGLAMAAAVAGCGLKGALALPEKNSNVVIRGGQGTTAEGAAAPATPAPAPPPVNPDKLPPPDLPHSNSGSSR